MISGLLLLGGCGPVTMAVGDSPPALVDSADTGDTALTHDSAEELPDSTDPSEALFDDEDLAHFQIELSEEALAALEAEPYVMVEGSFTYDGRTWGTVGVRTKGENSWQPITGKPSLKISFNEYVPGGHFLGMRELTLNAMNDDYSMMHERVAYRLYRLSGLAAARASHATVEVNSTSFGLYTVLDTVDRTMIGRWYGDDAGPLFEQHDVDFYDSYVDSFTLEYGEDDRRHIQGVADAMETADPAEAIAAASAYLDYDQFLLYWAVGAYAAQFDAYPYSSPGDDCHLYRNPESDLLEYIPHGVDETWYYPDNDVTGAGGIIATTCTQDDDCAARWKELVWQVVDVAESDDLHGYFEEVRDQIAPLIEADTRRSHPDDYVAYYQDVMDGLIANRASALATFIGERP